MTNLIQKIARDQDAQAFEELFSRYAPRIKSILVKQGTDPATAEELAQETMLTVWRKAGLYAETRGSEATWVFTIARNLRIDRLRKQTTMRQVDEDLTLFESDDTSPDEAVSQAQEHERVREALTCLPEEQREIIQLSYNHGLSQREIADRLSVPLGTVKSRMRLAYSRIRNALEDLQ